MKGERGEEPGGIVWTDADVRAALELAPSGEKPVMFSGVTTDSRAVSAGALFVALSGDRFDGHDYLGTVAAAGALGAVVKRGTPAVPGLALFEVDDTLLALGWLARARRRRIAGPVIAITGTNGKTSTKEMLAAALRIRYAVYATRANLNNLIGVPLTILEAPAAADALVVEAGASIPGEIRRARGIIEPDITVVTNAVAGHLEGFGSLAGVIEEKLALTDRVELAIVGPDPAELAAGARQRAKHVRTAGLRASELVPEHVVLGEDARPVMTIGGQTFTLAARGLHQADNAVRVWAVVEALGLDRDAAARALERFTIPGGRGELMQVGRLTILNDCYNANPQSFHAAIDTARALRTGRRLVFLAGTMRELGPEGPTLHAAVARALVELEPDLLGAVGEFVPALEPYAARLGERLVTAADPIALGERLAGRLAGDEVVVLKASRGVALERILPALLAGVHE
ncbi:MAG: UDP-N-acetylmuramoyl-tripeptide--D-alanyl-D-alanine ligase [Gemmatimonadales bacterium]